MSIFRTSALVLLFSATAMAWAAGPGVEGEIEQSTTSTPEEKATYASKAVEEIDAAVTTVTKLREEAKKQKLQEAVECLDRKLTPLKAILEVAKSSNGAMTRALAESDSVHAEAEFRKLAVAVSKAREFLQDAQQCVGSPDAISGKTTTSIASNDKDLIEASDFEEIIDVPPDWSPN